MTNIDKHVKNLIRNGITYLSKEYSIKECNQYKKKFLKITNKLKRKKNYLNSECTMIRNPYRHNESLSKLMYNKNLDSILKKLIGKDHILVNSTILNRRIDKTIISKGKNMGETWHTDSHYLNNKRLEKGITFIAITLFDDFNNKNGSTSYIPKSHNRRTQPNKFGKYDKFTKTINGKAGSIIIIDGGIWHKGGEATEIDRWSLFSYYAPWFIKPYFRFPEMLGKKFGNKCNKNLKRLFHYNSTPPLNEEESLYTVRY